MLNRSARGSEIASATSLRTLLLIWSGPHAFPVARDFSITHTSSFWTVIENRKLLGGAKLGTGYFGRRVVAGDESTC